MPAMTTPRPIGRLILEDGTILTGRAFGACTRPLAVTGEVVFNTAMAGYQEALTDPSYAGQILTMTAPMIGNYGVCPQDIESARVQVTGFVIRELSRRRSNYRATGDLAMWLAEQGVLGLEGIDTRALVRRLRIDGSMRGVITCDPDLDAAALVEQARRAPEMAGRDLACSVSPEASSDWEEDLGAWNVPAASPAEPQSWRVLALDCGAKRNIYRHLVSRGCAVRVAPHDLAVSEIRALAPDGLFISNGPGDPAAVEATIQTLRAVAGEIPTFGICLGHQLLALALGAKTYKLKFGHRGANQPVRNVLTGRVEITSQNHGFCVDEASLAGIDCQVTHVHLNDGTVAGFRHRTRPIFAVQFHPEAAPGPHDSGYLFDCFLEMMRTKRPPDDEAFARIQMALAGPAVGI
ncbi:MAG: glutamine-hydrolyzing carbamoyl-phosphate synthase small subunit [Planctomycetota bacterium]|jgi:carbamoyl-phosphate synthase small subunit